jgi:hypothetical protein
MKPHAIMSHLAQSSHLPKQSRHYLLVGLLGAILMGPVQAGSVAYSYDSLGRLSKAAYSNGVVITYSYDAAGNRTAQVTTGVVVAAVAK